MTENTILTVKIQEVKSECEDVKTLTFNIKKSKINNYIPPKPGQFLMVWIPGVDEVPMSISGCDENGNWTITVKKVGECTNAIHKLKIGDFIGVRGPLGNCFQLPNDTSQKCYLIGGSVGMAPLRYLASELYKKNQKVIIIEGAKNVEQLMFINELNSLEKSKNIYCTDDGSYGIEALTSDTFEDLLLKEKKLTSENVVVYACGPEKMIYKIFQICEKYNLELQASLERVMRCGCGLCGLCTIDPLGLLVCKDGPVFNSEVLRLMDDFGKFKRDFTGKKIPIE